jgi:carboxymethylenebutenolidase
MSQNPSGFATAVEPGDNPSIITTPTEGLIAGWVNVNSGGQEVPAYRAHPDKPGKFPTVLVVQEIFGLHEHIRDVCRRLAKAGYYAIGLELYVREGDTSKMGDVQEIITKVVSRVPDVQVMADLDASVAFAEASGKADTARLGITGFCWGGRITWLYATHNPNLKAGVAWYGRLAGPTSANQPKHPVDLAGALLCPVLGLYGGKDYGIPVDVVEQMRANLKAAGKTESGIILYPEAEHGFHADYRPMYKKDDAEDGWKRMLAHFRAHGVA